jgi:hypothetical protein
MLLVLPLFLGLHLAATANAKVFTHTQSRTFTKSFRLNNTVKSDGSVNVVVKVNGEDFSHTRVSTPPPDPPIPRNCGENTVQRSDGNCECKLSRQIPWSYRLDSAGRTGCFYNNAATTTTTPATPLVIGEHEICGTNMVLTGDGHGYERCHCTLSEPRPWTYYVDSVSRIHCYYLYEQGPCPHDKWIVALPPLREPTCDYNPCLALINRNDHQNIVWCNNQCLPLGGRCWNSHWNRRNNCYVGFDNVYKTLPRCIEPFGSGHFGWTASGGYPGFPHSSPWGSYGSGYGGYAGVGTATYGSSLPGASYQQMSSFSGQGPQQYRHYGAGQALGQATLALSQSPGADQPCPRGTLRTPDGSRCADKKVFQFA